MTTDTNTDQDQFEKASTPNSVLKNAWSIRPCEVYKDEYDDCTSIKARFHQYFVHGEKIDCSQWQRDFDNCQRYEESNGNDVQAGEAVIESEAQRRHQRMKAHFDNTTWKKRTSPPKDWAEPLPEWLVKRNENTFLALKQKELEDPSPKEEQKSYCSIM